MQHHLRPFWKRWDHFGNQHSCKSLWGSERLCCSQTTHWGVSPSSLALQYCINEYPQSYFNTHAAIMYSVIQLPDFFFDGWIIWAHPYNEKCAYLWLPLPPPLSHPHPQPYLPLTVEITFERKSKYTIIVHKYYFYRPPPPPPHIGPFYSPPYCPLL